MVPVVFGAGDREKDMQAPPLRRMDRRGGCRTGSGSVSAQGFIPQATKILTAASPPPLCEAAQQFSPAQSTRTS